jgi:hypothetical protein
LRKYISETNGLGAKYLAMRFPRLSFTPRLGSVDKPCLSESVAGG